MLEAEDILNGIVRGALGGRRKGWQRTGRAMRGGGLLNAKTLLAAAGVAWGLYETWQGQQQAAARAGGAGGTPPGSQPPAGSPPGASAHYETYTPPFTPAPSTAKPGGGAPPLPSAAASDDHGLPGPVARLLRIMISAARADGELGASERERILAEAREVGAEELVRHELDAPRPLGELVSGVSDPQLKEQLYTLAFAIVRADESVTGAERIYLAQLASRLGLDASAVARLEGAAAARIDSTQATREPIE